MAEMRRYNKNSIKKERIIMLASSAFVLAALTMTGIYMKEQNIESRDDGYTLDFTALENNADEKLGEVARNDQTAPNSPKISHDTGIQPEVTEDDLDYMPMEVGSGDIEIQGLTDSMEALEEISVLVEEAPVTEEPQSADKEASAQSAVVERSLHFAQEDGLLLPVQSEILMNYSMDASIYFATLAQYKYNPAVIFSAAEGSQVSACAQGKVVDIYEDAKIGKAVMLDLGDGYRATYGQLKDVKVALDSYVEEGDVIGAVAAPTRYYTLEGSNLYFQLTKDGTPVNPEEMFR